MKHERLATFLTAALLSFFTAWGAAGCLISAFQLPLEQPQLMIPVCAGAAALCSLLFSLRQGGTVLLCLTALICGFLYHDGTAARQLWQLLYQLSTVYNRAYGLGVLVLPDSMTSISGLDWPVWILVALIGAAVSRSFCRQKSIWLPVFATLIPLSACIVVTDTVPEETWLLMVMASLILLLLTSTVRQENNLQGLRLTAMAVLPVILALLGLFRAVPQESYVDQASVLRENILTAAQNIPTLLDHGVHRLAARAQGGAKKQVDLAHLGPRISFTYPVIEVTAEQSGTLYLRQQDFDQYNGLGWSSSSSRQETFSQAAGRQETIAISVLNRQSLQLLPYYPAGPAVLTDGCLKNTSREREYTITRNHLPENWRQKAYQVSGDTDTPWADYCALPEHTRRSAADFLADTWMPQSSCTEKADIIAALVTNAAQYDLEPAMMPAGEPDFAMWFLREGGEGYCVHFATAATVLLRAAGIPARYVTGYMLEAQGGRPVTVTQEHAHAWAEYYEPNLDVWIPLEATPTTVSEPPPQVQPETTAATAPPVTRPAQTEPVTETESVTQPPASTAAPVPDPDPMPTETPEASPLPIFPILTVLLLVLVLPALRTLRLTLRRRGQHRGSANEQALRRWQEAVRLSCLLKESPSEELMMLAQKAKFSQHELSAEELKQFDSFCRSCIRRLREKPWYLRLIHQYIYAAY